MDPVELIKRDLSKDQVDGSFLADPIRELEAQCPFSNYRLFAFYGPTHQFDFPTLPRGSFCLYAANGRQALRLTRKRKEICTVLADEWNDLHHSDPVVLASLVLKFYDSGIKQSHRVIRNVDELLNYGPNYELNRQEFERSRKLIGATTSVADDSVLKIRAITLMGWMHQKQNLGFEDISIGRGGNVTIDARSVLSGRIFKSTPMIKY